MNQLGQAFGYLIKNAEQSVLPLVAKLLPNMEILVSFHTLKMGVA